MSFIQPPTDNLYKFMAIFGLIIWGFSLVYPEARLYELGREAIQLEGETTILERENEFLDADFKSHQARLTNLEKVLGAEGANKEEVVGGMKAVAEQANATHEKNRLLLIKLEEVETKRKLFSKALERMRRWLIISFASFSLGAVLTPLGFILWYFKLQRYQDLLTKKQAEVKEERQPSRTTEGAESSPAVAQETLTTSEMPAVVSSEDSMSDKQRTKQVIVRAGE